MITLIQRRGVMILLAGILAFWTASCAAPFSRGALDQVDRDITFGELQHDPDRFTGKTVMLGGIIIGTKNTKKGSVIEVLQRPISRRGKPADTDDTEGRFLIISDRFLDAAVYYSGRMITVIGEASGQKVQPVGEMPYRYPVVKSKEIKAWEPGSAGPQVHFGVGLGVYRRF